MSFCLINKNNFKQNINLILNHVDIKKIAFVLKNNAYGHGLPQMAQLASQNNIKHAVVINYKETEKIIDLFETILVLSGIPSSKPADNISIAINQLDDIIKFPKGSNVELKVDTGMHRNGIRVEELDQALEMINQSNLYLKGVFTHFANIFEGEDSVYIQKERFDEVRDKLINQGFQNIRFHCCASPSLFCIDNNEYDLVRVGMALYGYVELPAKTDSPNLKPILSLWAEKISTRKINQLDRVGYGGVFVADKDMEISTYDIGYGDGFLRLDENKKSTIQDKRNILGRVSMNNLAVEGNDEKICIFDDVKELAKIHNTIPYEILCRIHSSIKKRVV